MCFKRPISMTTLQAHSTDGEDCASYGRICWETLKKWTLASSSKRRKLKLLHVPLLDSDMIGD